VRAYVVLVFSLVVVAIASPGAHAEDAATAQARQHYQRAARAYDLGQWDKAIAEYAAAYSLRSDPIFLYNMAQAHRRRGDFQRAIDLYKNYLIKAPDSRLRDEVEERIRALQKQLGKVERDTKPVSLPPEAAPSSSSPVGAPLSPGSAEPSVAQPAQEAPASSTEPPPTPAPEGLATGEAPMLTAPASGSDQSNPSVQAQATPAVARSGSRKLKLAGAITGGAGIVALAGGLWMGLRARSLSNEVTSDANRNPVGAFDRSKYDSGKTAETLQWVGYSVGAAALAGGAILYWLGRRQARSGSEGGVSIVALPELAADGVGGRLRLSY
jgi:hypothetical protein